MAKKVDPRKWQPPEIVTQVDDFGDPMPPVPWYEWFDEQISQAKSLRTIAKSLNIHNVTLLKEINRDPVLQKIAITVQKNWAVMLKERAMELAMAEKPNTAVLIYLLKTIGGLGDGAQKEEQPTQGLAPAMTKKEAMKLLVKIKADRDKEDEKLKKVEEDVSEAY